MIYNQQNTYPRSAVFSNLRPFLQNQPSYYSVQTRVNYQDYSYGVQQIKILVVGAGGLGCQIMKNLALTGIKNITLVDMDTIDFSNLNRQFLFRKDDVGKYKCDVVADFIRKRCPDINIQTHKVKVQELSFDFYKKFTVIIGGLDNVQARKYLNRIVFLLNQKAQDTVCFYIDGATQGFQGQALFVQPYKTSCYQCSLLEGLANKPKTNLCTLANIPRTPQHCIQYVLQILWQKQRGTQVKDNDNPQHLKWIYEKAKQRAQQFNIKGVTQMLALGVTKNIIPAIASTNALIAATLTNEVFKLLTNCNPKLNNYFLYRGGTSVGSDTIVYAKKQGCGACNTRLNRLESIQLLVSKSDKLNVVLDRAKQKYNKINRPFVNYRNKILLNPSISQTYQTRLNSSFEQLIDKNMILQKQGNIYLQLSDINLSTQSSLQIIVQLK